MPAGMNPFQQAAFYDMFFAGGKAAPGIMRIVSGCTKKTIFDIKNGGGQSGGTVTHKGKAPIEKHKIKILLWTIEHFDAWGEWVPLLEYDPGKQKDKAILIYNPILADVGLNAVVVEEVGPLTPEGPAGLFSYAITFINYKAPAPVKTATPSGTAGKFIEKNAPAPTALSAQERQIQSLLEQIRSEKPGSP